MQIRLRRRDTTRRDVTRHLVHREHLEHRKHLVHREHLEHPGHREYSIANRLKAPFVSEPTRGSLATAKNKEPFFLKPKAPSAPQGSYSLFVTLLIFRACVVRNKRPLKKNTCSPPRPPITMLKEFARHGVFWPCEINARSCTILPPTFNTPTLKSGGAGGGGEILL